MNDLIILKSVLIKYSMSVAALEVYPPLIRAVVHLQLLKAPPLLIRDWMIFCIDLVSKFK